MKDVIEAIADKMRRMAFSVDQKFTASAITKIFPAFRCESVTAVSLICSDAAKQIPTNDLISSLMRILVAADLVKVASTSGRGKQMKYRLTRRVTDVI